MSQQRQGRRGRRRWGRGTVGGGAVRRARGAVLVLSAAVALSGCGVVRQVRGVVHRVEAARATVDTFTGRLQAGEAKPFTATYATTGSAPATIVYAADPPRDLAFTDTASGGEVRTHLVVNASGEYACSPPGGPGAEWSCQKQAPADTSSENGLFDLYTPAHWVAFLKGLSLAAGFAGGKVTDSTMVVNGFALQCIDVQAPGVQGTSTICTTAQGILGYVQVAADSTAFEIQSYSTSPPASLFELPPGATVTTEPTGAGTSAGT